MSASGSQDVPNRTLDEERVFVAAEELVAREGWEALTMAALSAALGVKSQSLYRHVDGIVGVRQALRRRGMADLGEILRTAVMGCAGDDAIRAVATEYRAYAHAHPARYLAQTRMAPDEAVREAAARAGEAIFAALRSYGLSNDEMDIACAQLWALVHGFVSLELIGVIDWLDDPDIAFVRLVDRFASGLSNP
jgi:AcrR family transcriptional regulator